MTLDEAIKRYTDNAEYERTHGNLQGCLDFRQLAEWLSELKQLRERTKWMSFDGMTNGEVLINLYPNLKYTVQNGRVVTTIGVASSFDLDWWNAPYNTESEGI